MNTDESMNKDIEKVVVTVTKKAVVMDDQGRPALELVGGDEMVKVNLLPKNGQRREPVRIEDVIKGLEALRS